MPFCWRRQWWNNNSKVARTDMTGLWEERLCSLLSECSYSCDENLQFMYLIWCTDDLTSQRFVKFPSEGYCKDIKRAAPENTLQDFSIGLLFCGLQTSWCVGVFPNMSRNFLKTWDEMYLGTKGMMETSYHRTRWQPNHRKFIPPASTSSSSEKKSSTRWVVGPKCSWNLTGKRKIHV